MALEKEKEFKDKRKKHYNEYSKVKLARKLIEQELKDLEDESDTKESATEGPSSSDAVGVDTQVMMRIKNVLLFKNNENVKQYFTVSSTVCKTYDVMQLNGYICG